MNWKVFFSTLATFVGVILAAVVLLFFAVTWFGNLGGVLAILFIVIVGYSAVVGHIAHDLETR